jgi:ankyrin repeat protein
MTGYARSILALLALSGLAAADPDTRLVDAVMQRDTAAVRRLLKAGVDVNVPQGDGATALHWAAHWDDVDTVDALLRAKARVNAANELGATPLWLATVNSSTPMVDRLLEGGADPNLALPSGETPLMTAARAGNVEAVKLLLARGALVNAKERTQDQTALMWAVAERHPQVARVLVEAGADVHAETMVRPRRVNTEVGGFDARTATNIEKGGYTPLLFAVQQGVLESVEILVAAGAKVNEVAPEGTTALVVAAHSGHGAVARMLLAQGADPNAADAGYTALHAAILRGDGELVKALAAHGADLNAALVKATPVRRNSADYALGPELVGATPFHLAARFLQPAIMRTLAEAGADARFAMKDGTTPVMALVQARRRIEPGLTADPAADEALAVEGVSLALGLGADVNAANGDGNTALHLAAARRLNRVIQTLVEKGAKLDVKNEKGQTPLAIAASSRPGSDKPDAANPTAELLKKLGAKD